MNSAAIERSPIENLLWHHLTAWCASLPGYACVPDGASMGDIFTEHARQMIGHDCAFVLGRNVRHRTYVIDIVLAAYGGTMAPCIAIECDGHDYHERTKEQAARDKSRDRQLLRDGWLVMRFTGSEIYNYPRECVAEIRDVLDSQIQRGGDSVCLNAIWETPA